tara:strand:- start:794 stop:1051 length:258 start_codon:yes stop_codon:yes gene_type:complete
MKYKNTTNNPIFLKLNGNTVVVAPGEELTSSESLASFGLVAFPVEKPKTAPPVKVTPKKEKSTPKPKPVNTNEHKQFTNTDPSKD